MNADKKKVHLQMIHDLQCPGCLHSPYCDPEAEEQECPKFEISQAGSCTGHRMGTMMSGHGMFALGMPVGFNKQQLPAQSIEERKRGVHRSPMMDIFFFASPEDFDLEFSYRNVPVWYLEYEGRLFIRMFSPRIGLPWTCVVQGGSKDTMPESAFNVADFQEEIN